MGKAYGSANETVGNVWHQVSPSKAIYLSKKIDGIIPTAVEINPVKRVGGASFVPSLSSKNKSLIVDERGKRHFKTTRPVVTNLAPIKERDNPIECFWSSIKHKGAAHLNNMLLLSRCSRAEAGYVGVV